MTHSSVIAEDEHGSRNATEVRRCWRNNRIQDNLLMNMHDPYVRAGIEPQTQNTSLARRS